MGKEEGSSSLKPAKPSRFFKVILSQTLQNGTLEFPTGFVQKHGNCLSKCACVRVPTGAMWKVELRSVKGRVWLNKGWKEFVEYYSIKCGYFLVFSYESGSLFHVIIFDRTMTEIEYRVDSVDLVPLGFNEIKKEDNDDDDDVSIEILDDFNQASGDQVVGDKSLIPGTGSARDKVLRKGVNDAASSEAKIKVLQRAKKFKSKNPHFIICIRRSYIASGSYVDIPRAHFRKYLRGRKGKRMIVLRDGSNDRTWDVEYYVKKSYMDRGRLGSAWKDFVLDNHLQVGDVCIFEMISGKAKAYKVTILRVADYA